MTRHIILFCGLIISLWVGLPVQQASTQDTAPTDWLSWPVDCTLGHDCYIPRYVDHNTGPGVSDFRCNALTGNRHNGTDIAVVDIVAMEKGVDVLAAESGRVIAIRDGMADMMITAESRKAIQNVACGNNIAIQHKNGYITRYCHMRNGSILHEKGDLIAAGEPIGQIGLSGDTNFPHVHFSIQKGRKPTFYDPFTAQAMGQTCNVDDTPPSSDMWHADPAYEASGIIKAIMYTDEALRRAELLDSKQHVHRAPTSTTNIHAFVAIYGLHPGIIIERSLRLPSGRTLSLDPVTTAKPVPRRTLTLNYGKKGGATVPPGIYTAHTHAKDQSGTTLWSYEMSLVVEP